MKLKHLLMKTLFVAVGLCVGQSVWAAKVIETYDFLSWAGDGDAVITESTTKVTNDLSIELTVGTSVGTHSINSRFAFSAVSNGSSFGWRLRKDTRSGYGYQYGLYTQGVNPNWGPFYWSICNLKNGDRVTVVWEKRANKDADPKFVSTNAKLGETPVTENSIMSSGTTYTITEDGHLDLVQNDNNCAIKTVTIETEGSETIDSNPVIAVTGANNGDRTITITSPKTNADNNTVTYYTKDGTTPSSTSTLYNGAFTVTTSDIVDEKVTIKAITYKDGDTSIASDVATLVLTDVGTTLSLSAVSYSLTNMSGTSGSVFPVYTFTNNNSGVVGTPTSTLTATFTPLGGSESAAVLTGNSYTFSEFGTLKVTASRAGYNSTNTTVTVLNKYSVDRTYNFAGLDGDDLVSTYKWTAGAYYTAEAGTTTTPFVNLGQIEKWQWKPSQGFYNNNSGGRDVTLQTANEGEVALYYYYNNATPVQVVPYSSGINWNMPRYNTLEKIIVFAPESSPVIGATDYTSAYRGAFGSDIVIANGSAKKVTFKNYGSGSGDEYYKNWVLDINYGGALVTTLRSDWYAFGEGAFTYGYTYSSNAGSTADNTNVWGSWFTDMNGSEAELTLSHVGGKLYVIGTVSKGDKVYYMNYTYGDGSQTDDFTLNLSVDHSFIEMVSTEDATPTTTPAHPTAISAGNVGTTGYSTFASTLYPLDLSVISGAEVYYAEAVNGSTVKFKSTDASVPAGEGLLLKGTAGTAVTINIADAGTAISGNLLKGCTTETAGVSGANKYVLVNNSGNAEFQNLGTTPATIPAGKAYLDATGAGARSLTIVFDDEDVTGVNEVRSQKEDVRSEWFDLQGRKVAQPAKGLYIVNGKKVVIK